MSLCVTCVCLYVCVCMCTLCVCSCVPAEVEEIIKFPRAGVTGHYKLPGVDSGK